MSADALKTFSDSWHQIAGVRASLRATVRSRRQYFRGDLWYILHDPFSNRFFRLRPEAYHFVARLRPDLTVEEVWQEALQHAPDSTPGQEEVLRLLTQLNHSSLLYFTTPTDSAKLFERQKKRQRRELQSRVMSFMFVRIPLFDPDRILKRMLPAVRFLFSYAGALLWLGVVGFAIKLVIDNFGLLTEQAQGVLAPDNLIMLYLAMALIKTIHEFGHGIVCRRLNGEVHTMGVMFLVFAPMPYMDATSSWAFRSRWERAFVGAAGMIVELFIAALATIVWSQTAPGPLHSLAYNIMFVASVSTVLFNGNPLLRFDGYFILSDILEVPNLYNRSRKLLRHLAERWLLGYRASESPARTRRETFWMVVYGILSAIYRVVIFVGILLFVGDQYLLAGVIMAVFLIIVWGVVPPYKLVKYLATSPKLARTRPRAVAVVVGGLLLIVAALAIIPAPARFRAPGIVEAVVAQQVASETSGRVEAVFVPSGSPTEKGELLFTLSNPELQLELTATEARLRQTLAEEQKTNCRTCGEEIADLPSIRLRKKAIVQKLERLRAELEALEVRAPLTGLWMAPQLENLRKMWISRGAPLGLVIDPSEYRFTAVVAQQDASSLFKADVRKVEVRLKGEERHNLEVAGYQFIPYQHEHLPSPSLGWRGGGEIAVSASDERGTKTMEPFFLVHIDLLPHPDVVFYQERSGTVRFTLAPEPLLWQWLRKLKQILQKRYRLNL